MKSNSKKLYVVLAVLAVLVLFVRVVPWALDFYQSGRDDIAKLQKRATNYRSLIVDTAQWQQKEQLKDAEVKDLQNWIFPGTDANLVSSNIQRSLRQLLVDNKVDVRETGVPRYSYVDKGKWLMVEQNIGFSLTQASAILPFLRAIDAVRPRLQITEFTVSRNRRAYTGSVTVVGFARAADKNATTTSAPTVGGRENGVRAPFSGLTVKP